MSEGGDRIEPDPGAARSGRLGASDAEPAEPAFTDAELEAAVNALTDRERFREAEAVVARAAPQLQRILTQVLADAGWFGEGHEIEVRKAATVADEGERTTAVHTLLAEEARIGMMVGVAVGWALREHLPRTTPPRD